MGLTFTGARSEPPGEDFPASFEAELELSFLDLDDFVRTEDAEVGAPCLGKLYLMSQFINKSI